jgi:hypothetical protein
MLLLWNILIHLCKLLLKPLHLTYYLLCLLFQLLV